MLDLFLLYIGNSLWKGETHVELLKKASLNDENLSSSMSTVGETSVAAAHQTFTWQHVDILKYSEFLEVPCEQNNWNLKQRHVMGVCAVSEAKFMWVIVTKD